MTITAQQRNARRRFIGSSDSPAILGVDPWRSAHDVFLSKVYDLENFEGNEAIEIGNDFEAPLVEWAAKKIGRQLETDVWLESPEHPYFIANMDGLALGSVPGDAEGIEAKTTSNPEGWGDEGTDVVPDRVMIQTHHQMLVGELDVVWVPVLLAQFDRLQRRLYRVERNEDLISLILQRGTSFWEEHVLPQVPPSGDSVASLDVLKRIQRVPDSCAVVDPDLVADYEIAKESRLAAEKEEKAAKANLLAALGDAESAEWGDPSRMYTFLQQSRTSIDSKALKIHHPDIYREVEKVSTFRVLRSKKLKTKRSEKAA